MLLGDGCGTVLCVSGEGEGLFGDMVRRDGWLGHDH